MGIDRGRVCDAITAWRDGATLDARHPLEGDDGDAAFLWDENAVKDLARVIARALSGERLEYRGLPWSGPAGMRWQPPGALIHGGDPCPRCGAVLDYDEDGDDREPFLIHPDPQCGWKPGGYPARED